MAEPFERPQTANLHLCKKQVMINNFLGGLAWGLGSVIGATAVVAVLGYILQLLGAFSFISDFFQSAF